MTTTYLTTAHRALLVELENRTDVSCSLREAQARGHSYYYTGARCGDHIHAQSTDSSKRMCIICFEREREEREATGSKRMTRASAQMLQLRRYWPLRKCAHGHYGPRITSTDACTHCQKRARARLDAP